MGKKRLQRIREERGQGPTMEELKDRGLKDKIMASMDGKYDSSVAKARAACYPRWRAMTDRGPDEDPDFTNPFVHLEWILCDLKVQVHLSEGNREEAFKYFDDQQK